MSLVVLIALGAFVGALVVGLVLHARLWNAPLSHRSYAMPPYWGVGQALWIAWRRSVVAHFLGGITIVSAAIAPEPWLVGVAVAMVGVVVPLYGSIMLFNRPKVIVPPAARDQPGLLSLMARRVRPHRR